MLLSPQPGLEAATHSALELWNAYGGCQLFQVAAGGVVIEYSREWPGPCADPGIEACTLSGIFINPSEPRYDAGSVIAHELGHVLNFGHESGLPIMDPANWSGPATVWCDLETRCR